MMSWMIQDVNILKTMNKPSFYNISWTVTEEEYRADPALSYSTLAKYERSGFNELNTLFDRIDTPSLTFGSAVDSLITGGEEEFNNRFIVADFPVVPPSTLTLVKQLFANYHTKYDKLDDIPDKDIIDLTEVFKFYPNWRPQTRAKVIKEQGSEFYRLLYLAKDKTVLDSHMYQDILKAVNALKTSEATKWYFQADNPFENIERLYQLKFKTKLNGIMYRNMADLIIVDHDAQTVQPVDLKTSSKKEWDFFKSFIDWRYDIQARLYWRIIRAVMDSDEYFKDFKLLPYQFIVINKVTLTPLVWGFPLTDAVGTIKVGKNNQIELRDPCMIGEELSYYLDIKPKVPVGINTAGVNDLATWLDKL